MRMRIFPLMILLLFTVMVDSSFANLEIYILGPSGGPGGTGFTDEIGELDIYGNNYNVAKVHVYAGSVVEGIYLETYERGGGYVTPKHGGLGGTHHVFTLQEGEYITGISGKYGTLVDSIQIHTNRRVSRLYGGSGGSADYIYEAPSGWEVAGFCGREGQFIDAIGVVLQKNVDH